MARIKNVTAYLCAKYPHKDELSKARVTKLVYLADWKSAQQNQKQLTKIDWYFHNYGPYVDAVVDTKEDFLEKFEFFKEQDTNTPTIFESKHRTSSQS